MNTATDIAKEEKLIPVSQFVKTYVTSRGFPADVSWIYKLIKKHEAGTLKRQLPFNYKKVEKRIFIVPEPETTT